ncbi:soma ferritin [Caerostris darwini]|uniref:Ferritin n=1 Tax=Caerostris darwini TaxID=1538125 RepID=A0AAV4VXF8_9ARAC|nr:soma ferritin [Caerostris darwini]
MLPPLLDKKRRRTNMKLFTDMSETTSTCTARVTAQVNKAIYTFLQLISNALIVISPVKSIPTTANGGLSTTRSLGSCPAYYFDRDDVALPGFNEHFRNQSLEEKGHAEMLMKYQNKRGGRILLTDIDKPELDDWKTSMEALKAALALEMAVNKELLDLRQLALDHNDPQMCDFLDSGLLRKQLEEIKELGDFITNLNVPDRDLENTFHPDNVLTSSTHGVMTGGLLFGGNRWALYVKHSRKCHISRTL